MKGIFKYSTHFKSKLQEELSLGEGHTPIYSAPNLSMHYGIENIYLKDESKNPSGSFKDRGIAYQLSYYKQKGHKNFVISSTGNAAASAVLYCNAFELNLNIFISDKIPEYKLDRISKYKDKNENISIHISKQPKKEAFLFAKKSNFINLRQSTDDICLEGYKTLGLELLKDTQTNNIDGIFVPTSSGTGILSVAIGTEYEIPMYAIQTEKINTIAKHFDKNFNEATSSLATAISARFTPRKKEIIEMIEKTHGSSYAISDEILEQTIQEVYDLESLEISYDSALSVAGLKKALDEGKSINNAICILTGI